MIIFIIESSAIYFLNRITTLSKKKKHQKILKNVSYNFPEPKAKSANVLFYPNKKPPKDTQFTMKRIAAESFLSVNQLINLIGRLN